MTTIRSTPAPEGATSRGPDAHDGTALAAVQESRLVKTLGRADLVFFLVAAIISVDTIGYMSSGGGSGVTWAAFLAVAFLVPYAMVFAETSAAFPTEGGPYQWVKTAFGRVWASIAVMLYWVTNPIWLGGALAFVATEAWTGYVSSFEAGGWGDYLFKLVFIWTAILLAIVSLQRGKFVITLGAIAKLAVLASLALTALVNGLANGFPGLDGFSMTPSVASFLVIVPVALFAYLGFEAPSAASGEMHDPQKDTPAAIVRGAAITTAAYVLPVLAIVLTTPAAELADAGVMATVAAAYGIFGGAGPALVTATAVAFVFALMTQGSAWMIATDRMQAVAAYDGSFFSGWFGVFSKKLGTPVRMNLLSGVVSTVFMVAAMRLVEGPAASVFAVVLTQAVSTLLLSYLVVIPAIIKLRLAHPDRERPYRVPGGTKGFVVLALVALAFITLGSWVAVFPGTLEPLLGVDYGAFDDVWGVSRLVFEVFTLGTLAVVIGLALIGWATAGEVRAGATVD